MKYKSILVLLLSLTILTLSACSTNEHVANDDEPEIEYTQKLGIASGTLIEGTQYRDYYYTDENNGKYVKLKVKNNGNTDVSLSINDEAKISVAPGEEGTTQIATTAKTEKYEFWVRTDSGKVSVEYKVFQEN